MKWYEIIFLLWYGIGAVISFITANIKFFIVYYISIIMIMIICISLALGGIL